MIARPLIALIQEDLDLILGGARHCEDGGIGYLTKILCLRPAGHPGNCFDLLTMLDEQQAREDTFYVGVDDHTKFSADLLVRWRRRLVRAEENVAGLVKRGVKEP